jgi:hypothetical protein
VSVSRALKRHEHVRSTQYDADEERAERGSNVEWEGLRGRHALRGLGESGLSYLFYQDPHLYYHRRRLWDPPGAWCKRREVATRTSPSSGRLEPAHGGNRESLLAARTRRYVRLGRFPIYAILHSFFIRPVSCVTRPECKRASESRFPSHPAGSNTPGQSLG